jgi:hypothetical protein
LVIYDRGRMWIEHQPGRRILRYELRSLHGFIFCLVAGLAAFLFVVLNGSIIAGTGFACLAFGWLYGFNMFLAHLRVPQLIRDAAAP